MRTSRGSLVVVIAALVSGAAPVVRAEPAEVSQKSFGSARQALDAAIAAHGGLDALRAVKDVQRTGSGTAYNQGQSLRPGTPYSTRPIAVKAVIDFAKGRSSTETTTTPVGGIRTPGRSVLRGDDGFNLALLTNVMTPLTAPGIAGAKTALRRDPAALLLTAAGRAETLRDLGDATFDKRRHRVITFADSDGSQIALYLDAQSHRLAKFETLADNAVLGDQLSEVVLSDYRAVSGVQLPFRAVTRVAGEVVQDLQFTEIRVNAGAAAAAFEPPAGAVAAKPVGGPTTVIASKLADNVYFVEGSSHNSLAVVMADSILLIEAPLGDERSQAVIAKLAEIAPGKPVKAVVATHYHYDHSGGLRSYIARGATIYTTAGNRAFVTKLAATPHTIKPDALSRTPAAPSIEIVAGKKVLGDAAHPVELYDVGPSPHIDEMLVAYLPRDKVLYVADLITIPPQGPIAPGTAVNRALSDKLKKLGLDIQAIAPAHGRMGTMQDLQKALDTPAPN